MASFPMPLSKFLTTMERKSDQTESEGNIDITSDDKNIGQIGSADEKTPLILTTTQDLITESTATSASNGHNGGAQQNMESVHSDSKEELSYTSSKHIDKNENHHLTESVMEMSNSSHHAVDISNPRQTDYIEIVNKLQEQLKKKIKKWEYRGKFYSNAASLMIFIILLLQIIQLSLQPLRDKWISNKSLIITQIVLIALTAMVAALQLILNYMDKANKYTMGLKIYHEILNLMSCGFITAKS